MKPFVFKPQPFLWLNFLAILIFASWTIDNTKIYWDWIDRQSIQILNGSLAQLGGLWRGFWAVLSMRIADLIPLIFILCFFYFDGVLHKKSQRLSGLIGFVSLLMLMLIVREILNFYIDYNALNRPSPSLQIDGLMRLSELYPDLHLKDASGNSFPGDHAGVLMVWLGYCLFFVRNIWCWAAFLMVIVFSLPRLITGAHWLSDVLVGGVSIALISLAFGLYTPLLNPINKKMSQWAERIYIKILKK